MEVAFVAVVDSCSSVTLCFTALCLQQQNSQLQSKILISEFLQTFPSEGSLAVSVEYSRKRGLSLFPAVNHGDGEQYQKRATA